MTATSRKPGHLAPDGRRPVLGLAARAKGNKTENRQETAVQH